MVCILNIINPPSLALRNENKCLLEPTGRARDCWSRVLVSGVWRPEGAGHFGLVRALGGRDGAARPDTGTW